MLLNWFDITQPEGYFSLNDKISGFLVCETSAQCVQEFLQSAMESMQQTGTQQESFMNMIGGFTLLRFCNLLVEMQPEGKTLTQEQLIACNCKLNRISQELKEMRE